VKGGLMVCGTGSDVGKSSIVAGLCRLLRRRGVRVAPFKAQNMALNSFVTSSGHEIGRAQGVQALAAGAEPEVAMNPVLLKPTGERTSQVVLMGRPVAVVDAAQYQTEKRRLWPAVLAAFEDLRKRFDVVVLEGAGSAAEINLLDADVVNLRLAAAAGVPAVVVGDIDRGGVFASLYGTVALLPEDLRPLVRGFVVNKLRGDPALLGDGPAELERRCGVPTLGVVPWLHDLDLDAEDSLALPPPSTGSAGAHVDVAVIRFPRIANFTDFDALAREPDVGLRYVSDAAGLGSPDLVVFPGSKATVADLDWLRARGLDRAVWDSGASVLGICGGHQMLGGSIVDDVECGRGRVDGLGWLDVETTFAADKVTRQRRGTALGQRVSGYQIHHGRTTGGTPWVHLDDAYGAEPEGTQLGAPAGSGGWQAGGAGAPAGSGGRGPKDPGARRQIRGTSLHGLFEADGFRAAFLADVAGRRGKRFVPSAVSFAAAREAQIDRLADVLEAHLDLAALEVLVKDGARP
jgi:adenosylcobyric acid synthase